MRAHPTTIRHGGIIIIIIITITALPLLSSSSTLSLSFHFDFKLVRDKIRRMLRLKMFGRYLPLLVILISATGEISCSSSSEFLPSRLRDSRGPRGDDASSDHKIQNGTTVQEREKKILSIFSIVQFANTPCQSTSALTKGIIGSFRNGTCFTGIECSNRGGRAAGACAGGFGVCCVFMFSSTGSNINRNCSYIQNPGFPTATTAATALSYTISKCSCDVCYFRLDFDCFAIDGPVAGTTETDGGVCDEDALTITSTSGARVPQICGVNHGQHVYIDAGAACSNTATLAFTFTNAQSRQFDIKVSQIPCGSEYTPPDGCLQYHTGIDGRFTTFNFLPTTSHHLANQQYSVCIRQEEGYCCVQYEPCADANSVALGDSDVITSQIDSLCTGDFLGITGGSSVCGGTGAAVNMYCGTFLNAITAMTVSSPVCDCNQPFAVDIFTDAVMGAVGLAGTHRGLCLTYTQIPC